MPRRAIFHRYGDVNVLQTEHFRSLPLAPDQIRIAVAFAGVNYADIIARRGFYKWAPPLPTCLGFEVAGTVTEVGSEVHTLVTLARAGTVVSIGAAQVAPSTRTPVALLRAGSELLRGGVFHPFQLIEDNRAIAGLQVLLLWDELERMGRGLDQVVEWWRSGVLKPYVDRAFPLAEASHAHAWLESRQSRGKLVLC
jgi:NADPH:quinone reductase-like Zn-dependent oxidoreductase